MANTPILTVSQLTQAIKLSLETTFPNLTIQGEISNFKQQASGHYYFSIKDANSQISAVMFRGDTSSLKTTPKDGDQVVVKGALNVYPLKGNYQLVIRELTFAGLGELLLKLEELKRKLHKLGYFAATRKKPIPKFPKTIGVVTSPTGAVIQDILNVLTRRHSGFHLILNPVRVQGDGAANEIAQAIDHFNHYNLADVLIVGRGGGSFEDLWAFNEECVAEAIYRSRIPIIAAVGHESDHCIAEYVADVRAPTPSAAAELVMAEQTHHEKFLSQSRIRIQQTLSSVARQNRQRLLGIIRHPLLASPYGLLGPWIQKLDDLRSEMDRLAQYKLQKARMELQSIQKQVFALKPTTQIDHFRQKMEHWRKGLDAAMVRQLSRTRQWMIECAAKLDLFWKGKNGIIAIRRDRLKGIAIHMSSIDPRNLLKKGYTILFSEKSSSVISSVQELEPDQKVRMLFGDGEASATITRVISRE